MASHEESSSGRSGLPLGGPRLKIETRRVPSIAHPPPTETEAQAFA